VALSPNADGGLHLLINQLNNSRYIPLLAGDDSKS
jgi:hypothetical protein